MKKNKRAKLFSICVAMILVGILFNYSGMNRGIASETKKSHGNTENHNDADHAEEGHEKKISGMIMISEDGHEDGHAEEGHGEDGHAEEGHEEEGHEDGHAEEGHGEEGHEEGHGEEGHEEGHGEEGHEEEQVIRLNEAQMKQFGIEMETATQGKLQNFVAVTGEIVMNQDLIAQVTPRVPGFVHSIHKTLGDRIKRGDVLAVLNSVELAEARSEYDLALTNQDIVERRLEIATLNFERQRKLHKNTVQLLGRLSENTSLDQFIQEFKGKSIGENRARLLKAFSALTLTKSSFDRELSLREKKITSESDFLAAKSEYDSARSDFEAIFDEVEFQNQVSLVEMRQAVQESKQEVKAATQAIRAVEAKLRSFGFSKNEIGQLQKSFSRSADISRYELRSPIDGMVIQRDVTLGQKLSDDTQAFVIADFNSVWGNLTLYQKDLALVRAGQLVSLTVAGGQKAEVSSTIAYIDPLINEETRTASARLVLPNPNGQWRPGLFLNGKIAVYDRSVPLLIPKAALQTIDGNSVVFIQTDDGFKPSPLKFGKTNAEQVEVVEGLRPGQRYVIKGAFTLKAQLAKGSFGDGHGH